MQDLKISAQGTRNIPDYTCDIEHARELAKRVQNYYTSRGYSKVRAWIEPISILPNNKKVYGIRSNIVFNVSKLK